MITTGEIRDFECMRDPEITLNLPRSRRTPGALERLSSSRVGISIQLILPVQIASNVSARQARMRLGRSSEIDARERRVECSASRRVQYQEIDHGSDRRNALGVIHSLVCADDFRLFLRFEPAQIRCLPHAVPSAI